MRRIAIVMMVVGALIFALTAATAMAAPGKSGGKGPGKAKVVLCHKGKTITAGGPAAKGHQKHGDTLGACATTTPEDTMPETTAPESTGPAVQRVSFLGRVPVAGPGFLFGRTFHAALLKHFGTADDK